MICVIAYALSLGCAAAMLASCGMSQPGLNAQGPTRRYAGVAGSSERQYLYVTNLRDGHSEIDYWPIGSNGNVAPVGVISGKNTGLDGAGGIVVNADGEIYVANSNDEILGFPGDSEGDAAPNVRIMGPYTGLAHPVGLALDGLSNLYVANCGSVCGGSGSPSIEEFPAGSNGDEPPSRVIAGSETGFTKPHGIAVRDNGEIYLANAGHGSLPAAIEVFRARANGNQSPLRVIDGNKTELYQGGGAMAVDALGIYTDSWGKALLERFALNARGNARAIARIRGSRTQLHPELDGMHSGSDGSIYAVDRGDVPQVLQFSGRASGNVKPRTVIRGKNTRLAIPLSVTTRGGG